jgi:hypothetical protein
VNEEYGVEPEFFRTAAELKIFLSHFGMMEGRFIAEFPRSSWSKQIREHVSKNLSGIERAAAVEVLHRAKGAFIRSGRQFDPRISWTDNAANYRSGYSDKPFWRVLAAQANAWGFPTIGEMDTEDFFSGTRDAQIPGNATAYANVAAQIISRGPEIYVVDPYFCPVTQMTDSYRVLVELLTRSVASKCQAFVFVVRAAHVLEKKGFTVDDVKAGMLEARTKSGSNVKMEARFVDDSLRKLHARYLFSVHGGLRFDHGLSELSRGQEDDVSILDRTMHRSIISQFITEDNGPEVIHRVEI